MRGFQDVMPGGVYKLLFGSGVAAPQEEDYAIPVVRKPADDGIGEFRPAYVAV